MICRLNRNFVKIGLVVLSCIFLMLGVRYLLFGCHTPTLEDVLIQKKTLGAFDPSLFIASLLTAAFAVLSLSKSYEIFKRNRQVAAVEEVVNIPEEWDELKQAERLLRKSNIALARECERLKAQNENLLLTANAFNLTPHRKKTRNGSSSQLKKVRSAR
jgi:hypothetical protein